MLQELLAYYEQLAAEQGASEKVSTDAALAHCLVGEIYELLGQGDKAIQAYEAAEAKIRQLPEADSGGNQLEIAKIHNRIGAILQEYSQHVAANKKFKESIAILESIETTSREKNYERARSAYFMGRSVRPGMSLAGLPPPIRPRGPGPRGNPPGTQQKLSDIQLAINILNEDATLLDGSFPDGELLLARCYTELFDAKYKHGPMLEDGNRQKAKRILENLVKEYPNKVAYRFQLMQTLAEVNVLASQFDIEQLKIARRDLDSALLHGKLLIQDRPDVLKYQVGMNHTYFKLAIVLDRISSAEESGVEGRPFTPARFFRMAINGQRQCTIKYPDVDAYKIWLARMQISFAKSSSCSNRMERQQLLRSARRALRELPPSERTRFISRGMQDEISRFGAPE